MLTEIEMSLKGVLIAGRWRKKDELPDYPADLKAARDIMDSERKTLITELCRLMNANELYLHGFNNDDLIGKAATVIFLRDAGLRDKNTLAKLTDTEQRAVLIEEIRTHTEITDYQLQFMSNQQLLQLAFQWHAPPIPPSEETNNKITDVMLGPITLTLKGVLIAGRWRRKEELPDYPADPVAAAKMMNGERKTLIMELCRHINTNEPYLQRFNDNALIVKAAIVIFLRDAGILDRNALANLTDTEQRAVLIQEIRSHTDTPDAALQAMSSQQLLQLALQWHSLAMPLPEVVNNKVADVMLGPITMTLKGVLIAGRWLRKEELPDYPVDPIVANDMMHSERYTLITELAGYMNVTVSYLQGCNNDDLISKAATVIFFRGAGILDKNTLAKLTDTEQRTLLIEEIHTHTGIPDAALQAMSNQQLLQLALQWRTLAMPLLVEANNKVPDVMLGSITMTLKGVLIAGRWRRKDELPDYPADPVAVAKMMDGERNTLITELGGHMNAKAMPNLQDFNNDELIGKAAIVIFLRDAGIRDRNALANLTDTEQRALFIQEIRSHTNTPDATLQAMSNQQLLQLAFQWPTLAMPLSAEAINKVADVMLGSITMTIKGVLIAGRWRRKEELLDYPADPVAAAKMMDGERDTLIVGLGEYMNAKVPYLQSFNNDELIGKAAIVIFFRDAGIYTRPMLTQMTDIQQRNALIKIIQKQTDIALAELQALSNQQLVKLVLGCSATAIRATKNATGDGTLANPLLIDAQRKLLDPDDRYFVQTTVHFNPNRELQFNALDNQITKKVKISGVVLKWAKGNAYQKHMAYQGDSVFDLKELEIYADQVIISEPIRFPKTDVKIYARQLIFEDGGSINTTPLKFEQAARCPTRTSKGKDYPADKNGNATYLAADGKNGEKAGDVHLFVKQIIDRKPGSKRIIANGSKGQAAEDGGLKPYEPKASNQPGADKGKDLTPVSCQNVRSYVEKVTVNKSVDTWRWPGEVRAPENMVMENDALKQGKVVHCRLILFDDNVIIANVRRTFLPGEDTITSDGCHVLSPFVKVACVRGELDKYQGHVDSGRKKPGDGETAYASGKPGNGGDGGKVISYLAAPIDNLYTVDPGLPGDQSKTIEGGAPGQPFPAYWLEMRLVRAEEGILNSKYTPTLTLTPANASAGTKAEGKTGTLGNKGSVEVRNNTSVLWIHPESLGNILNYARLAYRNGHRAKALAILKPYFYSLCVDRETLPPVLLGKLNEIESILANMKNNLDYYGNPPGWLPRLDVKTNYQIWHLFSQESSKLLYFAQKMEHEWDLFEDQQEAISQTAEAVKSEMDASVTQLTDAYNALGKAKGALEKVQEKFEAKQRDVDNLRLLATVKAKEKIKEQQVFNSAMKLIGGLAEIIPVGQPYLGMAGKTIANAGDLDWNKPDMGAQFGKFFTKLGKYSFNPFAKFTEQALA